MKITKLIIPLLGLSQINNANNQANAIQIEKEINMPYEILARDDWDNYLAAESAIQNQVDQLDIQNIFTEIANEPRPIQLNHCDAIYNSVMATCAAMPTAAKRKACEGAAWASYWICMGVSG